LSVTLLKPHGKSEGLRDELEEKKQQGRARSSALISTASSILGTAKNFITTALQRATQRTQRWPRKLSSVKSSD
jgi:hypothetical protein